MTFDVSQASYQSLRSIVSEGTERIIAWVGAGLSISAGFPDWQMLRTRLEEALKNKAESLEPVESRFLINMSKTIHSMRDNWTAF